MPTKNLVCAITWALLATTALANPLVPSSAHSFPRRAWADIAQLQDAMNCVSGVHIIAARGSTEPQGEGPLAQVSTLVEEGVPDSDTVAVVYPASILTYESSEESGVANMTAMIQQYVSACPRSKIVLLGFSQGAQIVGDVLGGGSYGGTPSAPLDSVYSSSIIAAVQFGDPAHIAGKSYDMGTATNDGIFARADTSVLDSYAKILQSWCNSGDVYCDSGLSLSVHHNEVPTNQVAAAQFVIARAT